MFGHDEANQPQTNLPDPQPDDNLAADATATGVVSSMDDAAATTAPDLTTPAVAAPVAEPAAVVSAPTVDAAPASNDLLTLKQQALQQLTPLMEHLEQTPEERFRTTMMMIQASDNQALIKSAYDAALAIPDEKVRAQALLDVVNEINYFTTQNGDASTDAA